MTTFNWGAYFEWQVPEVPEFVDSRVDIFVHEGVLADYVKAIQVKDPFTVFDKYGIRTVLLDEEEGRGPGHPPVQHPRLAEDV